MRAKTHVEVTKTGAEKIIVTEIPYLVNKAELIQKVAALVNEKKIEGISNANDESDRTGMRIVFDLKRDAIANVVLNNLFKLTPMQTSFSVNNIALVHGRPQMLNIKELILYFVEHRHDVVIRRTKFELRKAQERAHILEGLLIALDHLDAVISLIRASKTVDEARSGLMTTFTLSEIQARAILDMRLQKLTGLERDKIKEEYQEIMKLIDYLNEVLANVELRMKIIKDELIEIKAKYGDERRSEIVYASEDFNPEDFYADETVVITISHLGYIKRTPVTEYRTQARGGKGAKGSAARDEDFIRHLYIATMHNTLLFFTEKGRCFWLKVYEIPEGSKISKGRAIQNMLNIEPDDKVVTYMKVLTLDDDDYINNHYITLVTKKGIIKKTSLQAYSRPRQNGINAVTIRENDTLLAARLTDGTKEIIMANRTGKAIRFNESTVRAMGRTASGVKGFSLSDDDDVIGVVVINSENDDILVVSENGYGKRSKLEDYRVTNRGAKGVKTINITEKTGNLIAIKGVTDKDDLMIINKSGIIIRLSVSSLRVMGRATQGVRLINLSDNDSIAAVAKIHLTDLENTENELLRANLEHLNDFESAQIVDNEEIIDDTDTLDENSSFDNIDSIDSIDKFEE